MNFAELEIAGAYRIEGEPVSDARGFFLRTFCAKTFEARGLKSVLCQTNLSHNVKKGTLRGMHFQRAPKPEAKLVSCLAGAIHDVVLDLRPGSRTFGRSAACELVAGVPVSLYIPEGCAHGFQTLTDDALVAYAMFEFYDAALASGVRYNDPRFGIRWPLPVSTLSEKDASYPDWKES